ncbi:MAG: hypothetical protein U0183_21035 [Polyangiaceae bacterium]
MSDEAKPSEPSLFEEDPKSELASLRAELRETRELLRELVAMLGERGLVDPVEVRARLANARRQGHTDAHPYRAAAPPAEPPPAGTVACAKCGTIVPERKVFTNANGRFCRDCFEPA